MNHSEIQAISSTITESGLCLFSRQIEWIFKKNNQTFEVEYRHYGMIPFHQILINGKIMISAFRECLCFNKSYYIEGIKIQIKRYGKRLNLLINDQDFDIYVTHLKTIVEIQDEPIPEKETETERHHKLQFRTFSKTEISHRESDVIFTAMSSPMINSQNFNIENFLQNNSSDERLIEDCVSVLAYLEGFTNDNLIIDDNLLFGLKKVFEKIHIKLNSSKNEALNQNLQCLKRKIYETLDDKKSADILKNEDFNVFFKCHIVSKSNENITEQKRY